MMAPSKASPAVRYVGDGSGFIPGVPLRDLTADEWQAMDPVVQASVRSSGIYRVVESKPTAKKKADDES